MSKFLIEQFAPNTTVLSFRPGELSNPPALPQALVANDYRFSLLRHGQQLTDALPVSIDL